MSNNLKRKISNLCKITNVKLCQMSNNIKWPMSNIRRQMSKVKSEIGRSLEVSVDLVVSSECVD